ncbi:hypothetical protein LWC33_22190 [Pseudonocardia sp. RS11V-5]|uniref:hypothetical protein n=1 Tax=Pseudonocardia terrae TaxID=2905831 RepID=UPI001E3482C3|nr:hypothetical protein [Pseudonocardia terrae]MCE3554149.1 hypothetical protein [Pseudonocardia terrae]
MRCARCGQTAGATTLSTHHTSEGWVRYKRCACGAVSIEMLTIPAAPERVFPGEPGTVTGTASGAVEDTAGTGVAGASGLRSRDLHAVRA